MGYCMYVTYVMYECPGRWERERERERKSIGYSRREELGKRERGNEEGNGTEERKKEDIIARPHSYSPRGPPSWSTCGAWVAAALASRGSCPCYTSAASRPHHHRRLHPPASAHSQSQASAHWPPTSAGTPPRPPSALQNNPIMISPS